MNLSTKINRVLLLMLLYETLIEAKPKKSKRQTSEKSIKGKHQRKKQFSPVGHVGYPTYPSPYPVQKVKIAKGLPASYDCTRSKYGCCWDGRTPAHGKAGKGCPQCRDVYEDFCKKTKNLCNFPMIADYCRITCKLCSKKKSRCEKSEHNCCWDGVASAKGEKCEGCPKIKDKLQGKECEKFESECLRNPYFMWTKCRATCLRYLPPIEPFLQTIVPPSSDLGYSPPPYNQMGMPLPSHAGPSFPYPFPAGSNNNSFPLGKKNSETKKQTIIQK